MELRGRAARINRKAVYSVDIIIENFSPLVKASRQKSNKKLQN